MPKFQSADTVLDGIVDYVISSDDFVEAVAENRKAEIEGLVEDAVSREIRQVDWDSELDLTQYTQQVESFRDQFEDLNENYRGFIEEVEDRFVALQEQNARLFAAIAALEDRPTVIRKVKDLILKAIGHR